MLPSERFDIYKRLMRTDRPIGTLLLLWPTLWALWIAGEGHPDGMVLLIFAAGVFLMRSAGCVINDIADRNIDQYVDRTKARPLAAGEIGSKEALGLFVVLCLTAFCLVLLTNQLTILLSFVAVALAALYPFMKRYTHWPQVFLGTAFSMAIPMAFAAQTESVPAAAWLIFAANVCWVVAYDTMYAMADRDDDLLIGVKSTAILFGEWDRHIIGLFQLGFIGLMLFSGLMMDAGLIYYSGLIAAVGLMVYHQKLTFQRERQDCFKAFLNNNYVGAILFIAIFFDYLYPL
ncbi:MAG: 4-hydroxybenzoate octaprenyltransferase [Mariprofundus sp.]